MSGRFRLAHAMLPDVGTSSGAGRRAWRTVAVGAALAVVFGWIGYQFRADAVGMFLGAIFGGALLLVLGLIGPYFVGRQSDDRRGE